MNWSFHPLRASIGARMLRGFTAMAVLVGALGLYAAVMLSMAGDIVKNTYDGPLMAINFARAASVDFLQMEKELLRAQAIPEQRAAIEQHIADLTRSFYEDLQVAEERSLSAGERAVIGDIRALTTQWVDSRRQAGTAARDAALDKLAATIIDRFDTLTELAADDGFVERRRTLSSIVLFKDTTVAFAVLGLVIAGAIAWRLRRQIVHPLSAAAHVANQIAGGKLQTPIPNGGNDETGALLLSMRVMQDNIRRMVEREMAERQSAQRRLVDAIESANEGMALVDAGGTMVIANSRMTVFFPIFVEHPVAGSDFAAFVQLARTQLAQSGESDAFARGGEVQLRDGRWIYISRSATQDGGFFLLFTDFTDIKEREQRYKEAKLQAEAANTAKSRFLANMSHELRTPLNAIIGFSEVISDQIFGPQAQDKYQDYAKNILDSGKRLLAFINNILDLARTETGTLELSLQPSDLRDVLTRCIGTIRPRCTEAELDFDFDIHDGEPLMVEADEAKLQQALINLLSNAVKFTPAGGTVSLRAARDARMITIEIADTGIGMAPEEVPAALAAFEQVDTKLARRYEGGGLGLPLAKALLDLHGGRLTIASMPGKGTTVVVTLMALAESASLRLVANS